MTVKRSRRVRQRERQIEAARANRGAEWRPSQTAGRRCPLCQQLDALICPHPDDQNE